MKITATYDPEDNKLRIYLGRKATPDEIERMRKCAYQWAPKQECNYATWNTAAEDLALEWAGEIDDEDSTLIERAETRSERFEGYSDKRADEAQAAREAVSRIADNISFGQPILTGHHSEKHARKDAERIENGMRKAVRLWETSSYWTDRAESAIAHAKYKEQPDVRHRRMKGIEADLRKHTKERDTCHVFARRWQTAIDGEMSDNNLTWLVNYDHGYGNHNSPYDLQKNGKTAKEIAEVRIPIHNNTAAWHQRWIDHCANRLAYESAMLAESGGLAADKFDIQPGGQVQVRGAWFTVIRVNKKGGQVVSVTTNCKYVPVRGIEEVKDYTPPTEEVAEKAKKAAKGKSQLPICNYPIELPPLTGDRLKDAYSDKFKEITKAEWDALYKDSKGTVVFPANEKHGAHRVRTIWRAFKTYVYITDQKRVDPPPPDAVQEIVLRSDLPSEREIITRTPAPLPSEDDIAFKQMKESLKAGVQVVVANQLFPTPMELAERMVIEAEIKPGDRILEPSAGMGNILTAIIESHPDSKGDIRICEINYNLCKILGMNGAGYAVIGNDFMELEAHEAYQFDRILMNPPFADGQDIEHITKALLQHLAPGGRLVAICANGPRQNDHLKPLILQWGGTWEPLPADTFKSSGTGVNTVLIVVDSPEHKPFKVVEAVEPVIEPVEVIKPVYKPVIQFIQES